MAEGDEGGAARASLLTDIGANGFVRTLAVLFISALFLMVVAVASAQQQVNSQAVPHEQAEHTEMHPAGAVLTQVAFCAAVGTTTASKVIDYLVSSDYDTATWSG